MVQVPQTRSFAGGIAEPIGDAKKLMILHLLEANPGIGNPPGNRIEAPRSAACLNDLASRALTASLYKT
jgi:hypothetical protein